MRITPVYNISLMLEIKKLKKISYDDLREQNLMIPKTIFDNDLDTLVALGYVKVVDGFYISTDE